MTKLGPRLMQVFHPLRAYWRERRGAAAAEFAIVLVVLVFPLLNVIDFGMYIFEGMDVNEAAQTTAEAALKVCTYASPPALPATPFCASLSSAEAVAVRSTSLGSAVTLVAPPTTALTSCANTSSVNGCEGYYCTNSSGALVAVGSFPDTMPADCSSVVAGSTDTPGDYLQLEVSYTYTPMFTGISMASLLPSPITKIVWMRLS
jgi:Flp pilus assembly protein TadG